MTDQNLPKDAAPLTAFSYWTESLAAWGELSQRTTAIMMGQLGGIGAPKKANADPETLAGDLLRSVSDFNLRHWQNTARLLEGLPSWMQAPSNLTGSALVDWFDNFQREGGAASLMPAATVDPKPGELRSPATLRAPKGRADDLTKIKGIGAKLSTLLNELGIYHYSQIATWSDAEARWVDDFLAFKGRVAREDWVSQARALSSNGKTTLH